MCVCVCKQKSSGLPLNAEDDVERVRASFLHNPKKPVGTAAKELSMSKQQCGGFSVSVWCEQFHYGTSLGFLIINVCNQGERYETPCTYIYIQVKQSHYRPEQAQRVPGR